MAITRSRAPIERSALSTAYTTAQPVPPYSVVADFQLTRRKTHHIIIDATGEAVFRSRHFTDILQWLSGEGQEQYRIATERGAWCVTAVRLND